WIPGSIVSRADARIASVIGGRVMWIAEVGTRVREGDPIARLDDTMPRLRAEDLRAQVARVRAQREVASSQLERFNRLAATQALSASQLEDARAQREVSAEDVARAEAQLEQAQYETSQSVIRAPFPGVVTERFIQRGEYVQIGAATVRLVNTTDIEARPTVTRADTVEQLDVTPGVGMEDAVEVSGPLSPGDRLVIRGGERLTAGQAVRVINPTQRAVQLHPG